MRYVIEVERLNSALNQEKFNLKEEKAKHLGFSDVIDNQDKEIKRLNIALDQGKEEIYEIFLRIKKQRSELEQEKEEKFKLIQGKDEETETTKYLVDYMTEVHKYIRNLNETLNNEKLEKLDLIREKDKAIFDAKAQGFKDVQEIVRDVIEIQQIKVS